MFADKMLLLCCRYVKRREDAEELLLDGFYKFFKNLQSFSYQGEAAMYCWLKRIMINECLMFLRKKNVFTIVTESAAEEIVLEEEALNVVYKVPNTINDYQSYVFIIVKKLLY